MSLDNNTSMNPKQLPYDQIVPEIEKLKNLKKTIAFCHGSYDILHEGHLAMFKRAKEEANILVVGIGSDRYVREVKGPDRPKNDSATRMANLLATGFVSRS